MAQAPLPLSVFIAAFNEADRIGRTLQSVRGLAGETIVVDSQSTDATCEIAAAHGARVIVRDWPGYGPQKRFAQDQCRHLWALALDADEVVTPALAAEIRALFAGGTPALDAYSVRQVDVLPGESAPPRFAHGLDFVRLFRRDRGAYSLSPVHDVVETAPGARIGRLRAGLAHYGFRDAAAHRAKMLAYARAQAGDMAARGVLPPRWRLAMEYPAAFLKTWLLRRYVLRGRAGLAVALNTAEARRARIALARAAGGRRPADAQGFAED
jgi:glycosyltransferase involved in cell wall biosynthesis